MNKKHMNRQQCFFNTIFVLYSENPKGTQVIVVFMNKGYVSDTARTQTRNLFRSKCVPIPLGHGDSHRQK